MPLVDMLAIVHKGLEAPFREERTMKMYDCDVCESAGSVNQWGCCEICGEEFEEPGSLVSWAAGAETIMPHVQVTAKANNVLVGQDAA
jgi:hypothetical protein